MSGLSGAVPRWMTSLPALEEALRGDLSAGWDRLAGTDPHACFSQARPWCMAWYRSYHDRFEPRLLSVAESGSLVGLVPLAEEVATRRLTFAGERMADFRDVLALPGHRRTVLYELLRGLRAAGFRDPLPVGPTLPESPTIPILQALAGEKTRARLIVQPEPCWRLKLDDGTPPDAVLRKKSIRWPLNHYRAEGPVALERVGSIARWEAVKPVFFRHHSDRQRQAGRIVAFDDQRKQAFYDALFREDPSAYFSVLSVGPRIVAEHFGISWQGVLYAGAQAFDIGEERYSPGQVLFALLCQEITAAGFQWFDFTAGDDGFKRRFGNEQVALPAAELFIHRWPFWQRTARDWMQAEVKALVARHAGPEAVNSLRTIRDAVRARMRGIRTAKTTEPARHPGRSG
jgi:CelD/BcsL family acetyltransferase involved in cellulose biosynthesis